MPDRYSNDDICCVKSSWAQPRYVCSTVLKLVRRSATESLGTTLRSQAVKFGRGFVAPHGSFLGVLGTPDTARPSTLWMDSRWQVGTTCLSTGGVGVWACSTCRDFGVCRDHRGYPAGICRGAVAVCREEILDKWSCLRFFTRPAAIPQKGGHTHGSPEIRELPDICKYRGSHDLSLFGFNFDRSFFPYLAARQLSWQFPGFFREFLPGNLFFRFPFVGKSLMFSSLTLCGVNRDCPYKAAFLKPQRSPPRCHSPSSHTPMIFVRDAARGNLLLLAPIAAAASSWFRKITPCRCK